MDLLSRSALGCLEVIIKCSGDDKRRLRSSNLTTLAQTVLWYWKASAYKAHSWAQVLTALAELFDISFACILLLLFLSQMSKINAPVAGLILHSLSCNVPTQAS